MSYAQCPICALRFRFQSELEAHAHDDHCLPSEVKLAPHHEHHETDRGPTFPLLPMIDPDAQPVRRAMT